MVVVVGLDPEPLVLIPPVIDLRAATTGLVAATGEGGGAAAASVGVAAGIERQTERMWRRERRDIGLFYCEKSKFCDDCSHRGTHTLNNNKGSSL